jgi:NitT/TauT family transport system substrate-binding protein
VRYYDRARNLEFFGTPEKSEASDLVNFAQDIWGKAGKLKMKIDATTILDTNFIKDE